MSTQDPQTTCPYDVTGDIKDLNTVMTTREVLRSLQQSAQQPRLNVRLTSFPESNGARNWTAMIVREEKWDGLASNCGGVTVCRGEYWNRVAYMAERARFLIGLRDTEPHILDYGVDIRTPEEWKGENRGQGQQAQKSEG